MEAGSPPTHFRRYDLDWLRLIAILILLFFHTGMWFNTWGWHVKNAETSTTFNTWMVWLHCWRMPLLLFISGAGTVLALGKRTPAEYRRERFTKLFIPLIFGMLVIVPPQIYVERIHDFPGYGAFYKTVLEFVPYPKGSFSWHHLWFIMYLLLYSLAALPFLKFLRSEKSNPFRNTAGRILGHPAGILFVPAILILISQIVLRPIFPEETHALLDDWAFFVFYFCFFLAGVLCFSIQDVWRSLDANRKYLLAAAAVVLIPFYAVYASFYGWVHLPWSRSEVETIFDVTAIFLSWFTVIAVIGYGQHYLNRNHPWLSYAGEGLYPFYILHQTLIIVIGYFVCQTDGSIMLKFWVIAALTMFSSIALYIVAIRPFRITRLLFGLKPRKSAPAG